MTQTSKANFNLWPQPGIGGDDIDPSDPLCQNSGDWSSLLAETKVSSQKAPSIRVYGTINGKEASILIDSGAEVDCISKTFSKRYGFSIVS